MLQAVFWNNRAQRAIGATVKEPFTPDASETCREKPLQLARDIPTAVVCDGVIDMLSQLFDIPTSDLRARTRSAAPVARVRQIGMYACHVALGLPMVDVADGFTRDRTTVMHACHLIEDMRDEPEFDAIVNRVEALVRIAFGRRMEEGGGND